MNNADFLKAYRTLHQEMAALSHHFEQAGVTGCPSGARGVRSGLRGTNDPTSATMQYLDGLEEQLQSGQARLQAMEPRFLQLMQQASGFRDRSILQLYYRQGRTDAQVAEVLYVSPRHANRMRQALLLRLDGAEGK